MPGLSFVAVLKNVLIAKVQETFFQRMKMDILMLLPVIHVESLEET
jgi:hypothetical protein